MQANVVMRYLAGLMAFSAEVRDFRADSAALHDRVMSTVLIAITGGPRIPTVAWSFGSTPRCGLIGELTSVISNAQAKTRQHFNYVLASLFTFWPLVTF